MKVNKKWIIAAGLKFIILFILLSVVLMISTKLESIVPVLFLVLLGLDKILSDWSKTWTKWNDIELFKKEK